MGNDSSSISNKRRDNLTTKNHRLDYIDIINRRKTITKQSPQNFRESLNTVNITIPLYSKPINHSSFEKSSYYEEDSVIDKKYLYYNNFNNENSNKTNMNDNIDSNTKNDNTAKHVYESNLEGLNINLANISRKYSLDDKDDNKLYKDEKDNYFLNQSTATDSNAKGTTLPTYACDLESMKTSDYPGIGGINENNKYLSKTSESSFKNQEKNRTGDINNSYGNKQDININLTNYTKKNSFTTNSLSNDNNNSSEFYDSRFSELIDFGFLNNNPNNKYSSDNSTTMTLQNLTYQQHKVNTKNKFFPTSPDLNRLRTSFYSDLIIKGNLSKKTDYYNTCFNNIFIFDWDDTLLPTSHITESLKANNNKLTEHEKLFLAKLEFSVLRILTYALRSCSDIYIISAADSRDWIKSSSRKYFKGVYKLIKTNSKIKKVYAKDFEKKSNLNNNENIKYDHTHSINNNKSFLNKDYLDNTNNYNNTINNTMIINNSENSFSDDDSLSIKEKAVKHILQKYSRNVLTNILTISDSLSTLDTVANCSLEFHACYYKNLKLMDWPSIEQLNKQITLLANEMPVLYSATRNINIKVKINLKK